MLMSTPVPPRILDWEQYYSDQAIESMPWFYPDLDPDLAQALDHLGLSEGRVLDLGTGPGTQAIALSRRGFDVTAADLSASAVAGAEARAAAQGVAIRFQQDDILKSKLIGPFDLIFDRGCFHVIDPARRPDYVRAVHGFLRPGGCFFLKCFSVKQPGIEGPHRFSPDDIRGIFGTAFTVESIIDTIYQGTLEVKPQALFCTLRRPNPAKI